MYGDFRVVHGKEVGGDMQGPVYARGAFKRQTLDETRILQFLYRPAWIRLILC
jgi:hypothetical protein